MTISNAFVQLCSEFVETFSLDEGDVVRGEENGKSTFTTKLRCDDGVISVKLTDEGMK